MPRRVSSELSDQHVWDKDLVLNERDRSVTEWASDRTMDLALVTADKVIKAHLIGGVTAQHQAIPD
jgi:hypothetical protein